MTSNKAGFTVIELLIAVAIIGILASIGFVRISPPSARLLSNDIKAMVHQARYEAVKRNRPIAFVWNEAEDGFEIRLDSASSSVLAACGGDTLLTSKAVADYPRTAVSTDMPTSGLVWLPTGQGRACNGAPMISSDIRVVSGTISRVVEVTMGGKVTIK